MIHRQLRALLLAGVSCLALSKEAPDPQEIMASELAIDFFLQVPSAAKTACTTKVPEMAEQYSNAYVRFLVRVERTARVLLATDAFEAMARTPVSKAVVDEIAAGSESVLRKLMPTATEGNCRNRLFKFLELNDKALNDLVADALSTFRDMIVK